MKVVKVIVDHDRRWDLGGVTHSPSATVQLYGEYLDQMVDESFGAE